LEVVRKKVRHQINYLNGREKNHSFVCRKKVLSAGSVASPSRPIGSDRPNRKTRSLHSAIRAIPAKTGNYKAKRVDALLDIIVSM